MKSGYGMRILKNEAVCVSVMCRRFDITEEEERANAHPTPEKLTEALYEQWSRLLSINTRV